MNMMRVAMHARRKAHMVSLNHWLLGNGDWVLTTEGLKKSQVSDLQLRIADYGVEDDSGETVIVGSIDECEDWAVTKGYVKSDDKK